MSSHLFILACLALVVGCTHTDDGAPVADEGVDDGVPEAGDAIVVPTYSADDFESFSYSFFGTGSNAMVSMDRDCGILASSNEPFASSGAGIVGESDCLAFKTLVVSHDVIGAFVSYDAKQCLSTDDYLDMGLVLSTTTYTAQPNGCSGVPPWGTVEGKIVELRQKYVVPDDAGIDAPSD